MQAIILNSGTGSRMKTLTENKPKCLLPLKGDKLILTEQIEALLAAGVTDIVITTGKYHDMIKKELNKRNYDANISYVQNPDYDSTNYIYSIYLAMELLKSDILLLHGDLVFDRALFINFVKDARKNILTVSKSDVLPEKDFKAKISGGYVKGVSVNYTENCRFCLPLYKLEASAFDVWKKEIANFVEANNKTVYAEEALNNVADDMNIESYYFDGFCAEVDCAEDYEAAIAHCAAL